MASTKDNLEPARPATKAAPSPDAPTEAQLQRGIIHTRVSRPLAWAMVCVFLAGIYGVPLAQAIFGGKSRGPGESTAADAPGARSLARWIDKHYLKAVEDDLEKASIFRQAVRPPGQALLARWGGVGNARAVRGREGRTSNNWLFYQPGVAYVTGPGFLEPAVLRQRTKAALDEDEPAIHPDPRPAILELSAALRQRGIRLVILPVPDKAQIEAYRLDSRIGTTGPVPVNPSFAPFVAQMRAAGVDVLDPTPPRRGEAREPYFLEADTHWTPQWMDQVAQALAMQLPEIAASGPALGQSMQETSGEGDLVTMLALGADQALFVPQAVTIAPVWMSAPGPATRAALAWQPSTTAQVLLLGDSFTNIFDAKPMGWGEGAGLAARLSFHLRAPVDVLARNDAGAYATRQMLSRELARGRDRLAGKKVVVWEFAARELACGDWRPMNYTLGPAVESALYVPANGAGANGGGVIVSGVVRARAAVPKPGTVPYKDQIFAIHLDELRVEGQAAGGDREAVVLAWGLKGNVATEASRLRVGQSVRMKVVAWADVSARLDAINRTELDDAKLMLAEPCWGELLP